MRRSTFVPAGANRRLGALRRRPLRRGPAALAAGAAILAAVACDSDSPSAPPSDGPTVPPPDPPPAGEPALECTRMGYPCSFAGVSLEVLARTDALGDEARLMIGGGAPPEAAARWLMEQPEVAEVEWDELALRFRVEGGRAMWIIREGAFAVAVPPGEPGPAALDVIARHVVAAGKEEKRALVISPFQWSFGGWDDGPPVAQILADTRGYDHGGGVTFLGNGTKESNQVGLHSFTGWGPYQVIHISSHGRRICRESGCRAGIGVGRLEPHLGGAGSKEEKLQALEAIGLEIVKREGGGDDPPDEYLYATADFFRELYPAGVADALVFFNACQTFGPEDTDLVEAIRGHNTVVLGWDEAVYSADALGAALALYEHLGGRGYPAGVAWEELGDLRTGQPTPQSPNAPRLRLLPRKGGGDIRIREIVLLLDPETGSILTEADRVAIEGALDDWVPDSVPFLVQVDGVKPEFAAQTSVSVSVDGHWSDPVPVSEGEPEEEDRWKVSGVVPLPYDLDEETEVDFRARVHLHSGGESEDDTPATLFGPLSMGRAWDMEAVFVSGPPGSTWSANAQLTLGFVGADQMEDPSRPFIVTGGTVSGRIDYEESLCRVTSDTFTYDVSSPGVDVVGVMVFNTATTPVEYAGALGTMGPPINVTFDCPLGAFHVSTRVMLNWMLAPPEDRRTASDDRRSYSGTVQWDAPGLVNESSWSARRIE